MTKLLSFLYSSAAGVLAQNPAASAGSIVFTLAFSLVAANALYAQKTEHPAPLWQTYDKQVRKPTHNTSDINKHAERVSRSILTQSISLNNVPVPTARPIRKTTEKVDPALVREIQMELSLLKFYDGKVDGIFGAGTQDAILKFQQNAQILPNGEASYTLLTNLKSATSLIKQRGVDPAPKQVVHQNYPRMIVLDKNTVTAIQFGLKEQFGEADIVVDGLMGNQTRTALRNFQQRFKLSVTGEPDEATIDKLIAFGILNTI